MRAAVFAGLSTVDIVYPVAEPPAVGRKAQADPPWLTAGGPAANAAVTFAALAAAARPEAAGSAAGGAGVGGGAAAAWAGVGGAGAGGGVGGAVTLVTALGAHPLAELARADLAFWGVTVLDATPDRAEPPAVSSAWLTPDGQRTPVSANAAGVSAQPPPELARLAAGADVVLLDGHHPRLALAAAAAAPGRVVLDGGSWKPVLAELLPLVRTAICSADFRVPGGGPVPVALRRYGVGEIAITAGPEPVRWWRGAESGQVPVPPARAVDTLGAGDAFHGAHAWAVAARPGADLPAALGFAAAVAAIRCETPGPRAWFADPRLGKLAAAWSGSA